MTAVEAQAPGVRHPPHLLWAALIGGIAIGVMLLLGRLVAKTPFAFDRAIITGLRVAGDPARPIGPEWLHNAVIDITALGSGTVLTLVTLAALTLLATRGLWLTALLSLAGIVSGSLAVAQLKHVVARPRPELVDHLVQVSGLSFPSGHAANSAIVYLTLAALATQVVRGRATRSAILGIAVLLVGAIGISRVYLGVHWPSDVLAGWSFGTIWAAAWWLAAARVRRRAR